MSLLLAAGRPDLVRGLVVAEADPNEGDNQSVDEVEAWLASWPVPIPSREAALEFFGGSPGRAKAWADGLALRDGGLWPRFEIDLMAQTLREAAARSYWTEWESIRCPTLVVRAQNGQLSQATAQRMLERGGTVALREVSDAGHDVHLDQPLEWRGAVGGFLESLFHPKQAAGVAEWRMACRDGSRVATRRNCSPISGLRGRDGPYPQMGQGLDPDRE